MNLCICGAAETLYFGEKNGGVVARCVRCGLLRRTDFTLEAIEQLYTDGTYYHDALQLEVGHEPYAARYDHDLSVAGLRWTKLMAQYRLLDVGCANGAFLEQARSQGMYAQGLELNPTMAAYARAKTGCPVHENWDRVRGQFDLITYHDVIEHVVDPQAEIDRAASYLAGGGLLILDTPDADDPAFGEKGVEWHHFRPEQHLWYFRQLDLERLLTFAGLTPVATDRPIPGKLVVYARKEFV